MDVTSSGYLLGGFHERKRSERCSLGAGVLAVRAERNFLSGSGEHFNCGEFVGGGIPPEPGATRVGVHFIPAGLRIVSNARRVAGGPFRSAASPYGWRYLVGSLHGADSLVADQSLGCRGFLHP